MRRHQSETLYVRYLYTLFRLLSKVLFGLMLL